MQHVLVDGLAGPLGVFGLEPSNDVAVALALDHRRWRDLCEECGMSLDGDPDGVDEKLEDTVSSGSDVYKRQHYGRRSAPKI